MKLAIELYYSCNELIVELIDLELAKSVRPHILDSGSTFFSEIWDILCESNQDDLFQTFNIQQKMLAIYFYLNNYITSEEIIKHWFKELNTSPNMLYRVFPLITNARILRQENEMLDNRVNLILNSILRRHDSDNKHEQILSAESSSFKILDVDQIMDAINKLKNYHSIIWKYTVCNNDINKQFNKSVVQINLSGMKELSIVIVDHLSVITGLTVSFTSFLQVISGTYSHLVSELCSFFPVGLRDRIPVAYALANKDFFKMLYPEYYSSIELYGFNEMGEVKCVATDYHILDYINENTSVNFLPYYLKFKSRNTSN